MKTWIRRLDHYWFGEMPAVRLAVARILVGAFTLIYMVPRLPMLKNVASSPAELYAPVGVAAAIASPLPAPVFLALVAATLILAAAFMLGWRHRVTGPCFSLLLLFVLCYRNSWSMIYHSDNPLVLHALILGFARSADALSLDSLASRTQVTTHSGWPIRLICLVTALIYFLAGLAKVSGPLGWSWVAGEAMRGQMAVDGLRKELLGGGASPLAFLLYDQVWFFGLLGIGTLILELGAPFALLREKLSRFWAFGVWMMHWGILLIMDIKFEYALSGIVFAAFVPWERLIAKLPLLSKVRPSPFIPQQGV